MDVLWLFSPSKENTRQVIYKANVCNDVRMQYDFYYVFLFSATTLNPLTNEVCVIWHPRNCQDPGFFFPQQNVAPQQDGQRYLSWPSAVLIWVLISVALNTLQQIPVEYGFTKMEQDQLTPEERPNVKMLIRHVFTQGSNGKSLPLKCTNNRITQHNVDYNQTCIM